MVPLDVGLHAEKIVQLLQRSLFFITGYWSIREVLEFSSHGTLILTASRPSI
jgi:hypothetical protein